MSKAAIAQIRPRLLAVARNAIARGGVSISLPRLLYEACFESLTRTAMAAHLTGYAKVWEMADDGVARPLRLSAADSAIEFFGKRFGVNLTRLERRYQTSALKMLGTVSNRIEKSLAAEFQTILSDGAHVAEGVDRLGEVFDRFGLTPSNSYMLENIYRTQTQIAYAGGKWAAEQSPEIQEILWGYTYATVGDDRVREDHAAMDGVTLPKSDPIWAIWMPPNGWSCRCTAIPIFEEREPVRPTEQADPDEGFRLNFGAIYGQAI